MKKRVLLATGQDAMNLAIEKMNDYTIIGIIHSREDLYESCKGYNNIEILLVSENLSGEVPLAKPLLKILKQFTNIRIIYLAGEIDFSNEGRVNSLAMLAMTGIHDIIYEKKITLSMLRDIFKNPKDEKYVEHIIKKSNEIMSRNETSNVDFIIPEEYDEKEDDIRNNLHVISSIKPGTGKSFLSTNIAAAIAQYGIDTKDGKRPKVGLIEADLQNLSLGTLLQIEDDKNNLKTVMQKISSIVTSSGDFIGNPKETEEVNDYIKNCFISYYRVKNLKALVGSQLTLDELEEITNYHYIYLIDAITEEFDVLIVDSNSALTHITTYPLLHMAKSCYYIINLDFNNVRNNIRYREMLKELGIKDKVRYVLNEDLVEGTYEKDSSEELIFTSDHLEDSGFKLEAKIPTIPKVIFLNRLYEGTPIVLDEKKSTEYIRFELLKVANQIYPIKNFSKIEEDMLKNRQGRRRGFFRG